MRLTRSFVLPQDAELLPAIDFSEELRRSSGADDGDFALSRRNSRSHSKIVDAETARLLRHFEKPTTIARAVARFSRSQSDSAGAASADRLLEEALPLLRSLVEDGLLVEAESAEALPSKESLTAGDRVEQWSVGRCIQSLEDTELYLVSEADGRWGALKIGRPGQRGAQFALEREAEVLKGSVSRILPRLLGSGTWRERPYLVTEWIFGVDAESAAAGIRRLGDPRCRREMLKLGAAILDAYTALHELGLLHGDIHPRNLMVDRQGQVHVLDFGLTARLTDPSEAGRGGISFFFEPEFARAALSRLPPPPPSLAGEQYALGCLLYLVQTGAYTQDFNLERSAMLTQIASGAMKSFEKRGLRPWPDVEQVLAKALSIDAADRYPSTRTFAEAWRAIEDMPEPAGDGGAPNAGLGEIRREVQRHSAIGGSWMRHGFDSAPTAPLNSGSAGLAYALYRIACASDDGELLALADAWSTHAWGSIGSAKAFDNDGLDHSVSKAGLASLQYQPPGVYAAHALIASGRGDLATQSRAAGEFIAWGRRALTEPEARLDLTLGFAGSLLGAALLLDSCAGAGVALAAGGIRLELLAFGRELCTHLWWALDNYPALGEPFGLADTGVAHGWAGILYATLCWCAAAGEAPPTSLPKRLDDLARRAEPLGRGLHWPWRARFIIPGWCNGSAGQVFLWTQAHRALGNSEYLALAEGAAWSTWENPGRIPSLCCGLAGQAYALLNIHRYTGETAWLRRAEAMAAWAAEIAARDSQRTGDSQLEGRPGSLYNGLAGLAVLDADLERPLEARMPFFERD